MRESEEKNTLIADLQSQLMIYRGKERHEETEQEVLEGDASMDKIISNELVKVEGVIYSEKQQLQLMIPIR